MNNKYTIIKQESIEELNGTGYLLKHNKTGARVVVVSNEDDNKVFQIGFRTPPKDDTGSTTYLRAFRIMRIKRISNERPVCRTGQRIIKHIFKCYDISRQDSLSGCKPE